MKKDKPKINWLLLGGVVIAVLLLLYWLLVTIDLSAYYPSV